MRLIISMCQPMKKQQTRLKYQMQGPVRAQLLQWHVIDLPPPLLRPLRPLFHPCPPLRTQLSLPCHPSPPLTSDLPRGLPMLEFESSPHTTTIDHNSPIAPSYSSPQTVMPTLSLQTPYVELMSTSPSHTQSPPTSSTLIHVPQATHPHDNNIEQQQRDQAEQPQDANAHAPPKQKSTRAIQPRRCGTGSHLVFQVLYFDFNFICFSCFFVHEFVCL